MYECHNNSYKYAAHPRQATKSEYPVFIQGGKHPFKQYTYFIFILI